MFLSVAFAFVVVGWCVCTLIWAAERERLQSCILFCNTQFLMMREAEKPPALPAPVTLIRGLARSDGLGLVGSILCPFCDGPTDAGYCVAECDQGGRIQPGELARVLPKPFITVLTQALCRPLVSSLSLSGPNTPHTIDK